jgi:glycosyltransferase involved in cell wall biosynthesis
MTHESERTIQRPKVTIGMPVFNGDRFLAESIESALSQKFGDFEFIIADNSSTDGTSDICQSYAKKDSRIKYVRHPRNLGAAKNYNYVFHCSSSPFFCWLACDDILHSDFLDACLDGFVQSSVSPVLVYPNFQFIDEQGVALEGRNRKSPHTLSRSPVERLNHALDNEGFMIALFGLFRRDLLKKTRLIGSFASSDYVLLSECALIGPILKLDGPPLFSRRLHAGRSRLANTTTEAVSHWFDPDLAGVIDSEGTIWWEYVRSVFTVEGLDCRHRLAAASAIYMRRVRQASKTNVRTWKRAAKSLTGRP